MNTNMSEIVVFLPQFLNEECTIIFIKRMLFCVGMVWAYPIQQNGVGIPQQQNGVGIPQKQNGVGVYRSLKILM